MSGMSNQVQSNEMILWLLGLAVVLVLGLLLAEYLTRRVRYMWKLRRTHEQVLPRFKQPMNFTSGGQKVTTS